MRRPTPRATSIPPRRRASPRAGAALAALVGAGLAAGCTGTTDGAPRPTAVLPDRGALDAPVPIRIRGEGFAPRVTTDFADPTAGRVDAGYEARLGAIALQDVVLQADGDLAATVPAGLASGFYDLTVVDPRGRSGTLRQAYRSLVPGGAGGDVAPAAYRLEPFGDQEAFRPFMVTVAALDAAGAVLGDFSGSARLSDRTGTAVPDTVARFVGGRWTGLVEVRAPHAADVLTIADDGGASGTSAPFAVAAPRPALVRLATPPVAATAGRCAGPVTLVVTDAFGVPTPVDRATALTVGASPADGFTLHGDAGCGARVDAPVVAAGQSSVDAWFVATRAGALDLAVSARGLASSVQRETVAAGAPAALAFVSPPQVVNAGACSQRATVEVRDAFGNPSAPGAVALTPAAAPANGFAFFANDGCSVAAPALPLGAGATRADFFFTGDVARVVSVTIAASGVAPASQDVTVTPSGSASRLAFASPPRGVAAGACSEEVTLQTQDSYGNPVAVAAGVTVDLAASPVAGFATFSDPACTTPAAAVPIAAGQGAAGFFYRGTQAGTVTVTASAAALTAASQRENVNPGAPSQVAFASASQTLPAGSCSAAVALQVRDRFGNAAPVAASLGVALAAAPSAGLVFHADAACTQPLARVTVPGGANGASFHFSGTQAGPAVVSATPDGLPGAEQTELVRAAAATRLAFTSGPQAVETGACSGTVAVEVRDAFDNVATLPGAMAVSLAADPPAGFAFYRDAACATPAPVAPVATGGSGATFHFAATAPGAVTVTASAAGLASDDQAETVTTAPPAQLAFTTAARTVAAGDCSGAIVLETRDGFGNPSPVPGPGALAIALGAAPADGVAFFAGDGCGGDAVSSVSVAPGATTATLSFRATASGRLTVSAAAAGVPGGATQDETVVAAAPDHLAFASAARSVAAGACSDAVDLQVLDRHGNASPLAAATAVALRASPAGGVAFFAGAGCSGAPVFDVTIGAGGRGATFSFRATASGSVTLAAAAAGLSPDASQVETVRGGALDHFTWAGIPSPQADAVPFLVTVTARDAWDNVADAFGGTAALSASAGAVTCRGACTSAGVTGGFAAGVWSGRVSVSPHGTGLTLRATSGAASGASAPFDVSGPAARSPPRARFTVSPVVLVSGADLAFDAGGSSDGQTAAASLAVSWDFEATAASMDGAAPAPPAAPWSAWTTTKTARHAFINNGSAAVVYHPRVAVRDAEGGPGGPDVAYASATVVVLQNGNGYCVVDTATDSDDGASSCYAKGSDGRLSFREALRLANASAQPIAVTFSGPMTVSWSGTFRLTRPVFVVAPAGVVLDTGTLSIAASGVLVAGVELARQASPIVVEADGDATFREVTLRDGAGLVVRGRARLDGLQVSGCTGTCITVDGAGAWLALSGSDLRGSGTNTGLALTSCADVTWSPATLTSPYQPYNGSVVVAGNVFREFGTAVDSSCPAAVVAHDTFVGNATGVHGIGAVLLDCIFEGQGTAAVSAAACPGFGRSLRHLVWQNASDGCLAAELAGAPAADATFSADPRFVHPGGGDHRLQHDSPAKDQGAGLDRIDLDGPGPVLFLGAAADRGGRETY